jgi:uncharacterized membrane protein
MKYPEANKKFYKYHFIMKVIYFIIGITLHCYIFIGKAQDFFDSFDNIVAVAIFWIFYSLIFMIVSTHLFRLLDGKYQFFDEVEK